MSFMQTILKLKFIIPILLLITLTITLAIVPKHQVVMDCERPAVGRFSLSPSVRTMPTTYRFTETLLGVKSVESRGNPTLDSKWRSFCSNDFQSLGINDKLSLGDLFAKCSKRFTNFDKIRRSITTLDFFNKKLSFYYWENDESFPDEGTEYTQEYETCKVRDDYHLRVYY